MRIPFSIADILEKDDRKRILFIDDIFDSWESPTLKPMMELLSEEFCCCRVFKDRRPDSAVTLARNSCIGPYKPNLIVAHGSGATIAAQIKGIEKVLIKPYYNTSNILKDMLGPQKLKARIELPTLEKKEYLTITRSMVLDYKHLEIRALQNGYNNNAHSLFFANDIETNTYKWHREQFSDAVIIPGNSLLSPDGIDSATRFIRGIMELVKSPSPINEDDFDVWDDIETIYP